MYQRSYDTQQGPTPKDRIQLTQMEEEEEMIQPNLEVGKQGDKYEREEVLAGQKVRGRVGTSLIQRQTEEENSPTHIYFNIPVPHTMDEEESNTYIIQQALKVSRNKAVEIVKEISPRNELKINWLHGFSGFTEKHVGTVKVFGISISIVEKYRSVTPDEERDAETGTRVGAEERREYFESLRYGSSTERELYEEIMNAANKKFLESTGKEKVDPNKPNEAVLWWEYIDEEILKRNLNAKEKGFPDFAVNYSDISPQMAQLKEDNYWQWLRIMGLISNLTEDEWDDYLTDPDASYSTDWDLIEQSLSQKVEAIKAKKETLVWWGQREPDHSKDGNYFTWYIDVGGEDDVFAIQINNDIGRWQIIIGAQRTPMVSNPDITERAMPLAVGTDKALDPIILDEIGFEGSSKLISIQLDKYDEESLLVSVGLEYTAGEHEVIIYDSQSSGSAKFSDEWIEAGSAYISDGYRQINTYFQTASPKEYVYAVGWRWYNHPAFGHVRMHPTFGFVIFPDKGPQYDPRELIRTMIHLIPIVGSLVMVFEAMVGYTIFGRELGMEERAILGASALLAEFGPLLRAGKTAVAATKLATVSKISKVEALRVLTGARTLTKAESEELAQLAKDIKAGKTLTARQITRQNYLLGKLNEGVRVKGIRGELEAQTGVAHKKGRFTNLNPKASVEEVAGGELLAKELDADVVGLAETAPMGAKNPDYLVDDILMDLYSPQTNSIDNLFSNVAGKGKQAGVIVINTSELTAITVDDVFNNAYKLWEKSVDISQIIVIDAGTNKIFGTIFKPVSESAAPTIIKGSTFLLPEEER